MRKDKLSVAMITSWRVRCGIATYSENLAKALADLGVDVYIVRLPRFGAKSPEILQNLVDSIPADRVDLVHVQHEYGLYQNLEGGFYGGLKRLGKPLITTMHAVGNWDVDRVIATTSDRVIVHNEFCFRRFGFPKKTVVIPHGATAPVECPPAEEAKRSLGIPVGTPVVGYCGFISSYKGLEFAVEAMQKVPEAALLIAGGWHAGPGTEYIMDLKRRSLKVLKGRCQWLGWVPDEQLPTVYGCMDIVIYPSMFATESGALIMALSHGKAVLASNLAPFKSKEKLGALLTFRDTDDLRRMIKRLLKDEELRQGLERGARDYAESVSWPVVALKHMSLYEDVIERWKGKTKQ